MISPVTEGQIQAYSYMVKNGKPAAMLPVHDRDIDAATELVTTTFGLNAYVEDLAEGWKTLWIYKHEHIAEVIKSLPQAPKTIVDHWILGKLFGYEESAISDFLKSKLL